MQGKIRVIIVDRHKRRQADIVEPPARTNTLFIIDDAEGLLMLFQVVQEGSGRQRLFQIVLAPAFIDNVLFAFAVSVEICSYPVVSPAYCPRWCAPGVSIMAAPSRRTYPLSRGRSLFKVPNSGSPG